GPTPDGRRVGLRAGAEKRGRAPAATESTRSHPGRGARCQPGEVVMNEQVRVTGIGTYLPQEELDNSRLPPLDQPMSRERLDALGILSRRHANEAETVTMMGEAAARDAMERAGVEAEALDFVILANWSERRFVPDV